MGRDVNDDMNSPRREQSEWLFSQYPDKEKCREKNHQTVSAIIEVLCVLREFENLWMTMIKSRHARGIEEYQTEHYPFSENVRQYREREGGKKYLSAFPP